MVYLQIEIMNNSSSCTSCVNLYYILKQSQKLTENWTIHALLHAGDDENVQNYNNTFRKL